MANWFKKSQSLISTHTRWRFAISANVWMSKIYEDDEKSSDQARKILGEKLNSIEGDVLDEMGEEVNIQFLIQPIPNKA
jgi:hypothetical protein